MEYILKVMPTEHNMLECFICKKKFNTQNDLKYHLPIHGGRKPFECMFCNKMFHNKRYLDVHVASHKGKFPHHCDFCNKGFIQNTDYAAHMKIHAGKQIHTCIICRKTFLTNEDVKLHVKIHSTEKILEDTGELLHECCCCKDVFMHKKNVEIHLGTHVAVSSHNYVAPEESHECDICLKQYKKKSDLDIHRRIHALEKPHVCTICYKSFMRADQLKNHLKNYHLNQKHIFGAPEKYECDVCKELFDETNLEEHLEIHMHRKNELDNPEREIGTDKMFQCEVCGKTLSLQRKLNAHRRIHTGERQHECNICKDSFMHSKQLIDHLRKKHINRNLNSENSYKCDACKETLSKNDVDIHIRNHMRKKTGENMASNTMEYSSANQVPKESVDVVDHEKMDTNDIRAEIVYECGICFKRFSTESHLKAHKEIHVSEKEIKCDVCEEMFRTSLQLRRHFRTTHLAVSKAKSNENECDICKKQYMYPYQLRNHIKSIHIHIKYAAGTSEKSYECKMCKEIFNKYDMERHIKFHMSWRAIESAEVEAYKCSICNETFEESLNLKEHFTLHKNYKLSEKPYKCDICLCTFGSVEVLKAHINNHKGTRPFFCDYCGDGFTKKIYLENHKKNKHKNEISKDTENCKSRTIPDDCITIMFDCDICQESFPERNLMIDHQRIHEEVRSFECNLCKNTFDQSDELKGHLRQNHVNKLKLVLGKILYECDNCKETFKNYNDLDTHLNIYMNEFSDDCLISKNASLQPTQTSVSQKCDDSMAEITQNNIHLIVANSEAECFPAVTKLPLDGTLPLLQSTENSMEIDDIQNQNVFSPIASPSTTENTIIQRIANSKTRLVTNSTSEISKFKIYNDYDEEQVENDFVQTNSAVEDTFVSKMEQSDQITVKNEDNIQVVQTNAECDNDKALSQINQNSDIAVNKITQAQSDPYEVAKAGSSRQSFIPDLQGTENETTQRSVTLYQCHICKAIFSHIEDLTSHLRTENHASESPMYKCDICLKTYKLKLDLKEHERVHKAEYECEICKKTCMRDYNLKHHLLNYHTGTNYINGTISYECVICKNKFSERSYLEIHLQIHINNNFGKKVVSECNSGSEDFEQESEIFQCSICEKTFSCENELSVHAKFHTEEKLNVCTICKDAFASVYHLRCHLKIMHMNRKSIDEENDILYECDFCKEIFDEDNLGKHLKIHMIKKRAVKKVAEGGECSICKQTFEKKSDLEEHNKFHIYCMRKEKQHICEICYKRFPTKICLTDHKKLHIKTLVCYICKSRFRRNDDLRKHLRLYHKNVILQAYISKKSFKCCECKQAFEQSEDLETHLNTHTNTNKCNICLQLFEQDSDLKNHLKVHAEDCIVEVLECTFCQKIFPDENQVIKHARIHMSTPSLKCAICQTNFYTFSESMSHLQTCHTTNYDAIATGKASCECGHCKATFKNINDLNVHLETYISKTSGNAESLMHTSPYTCYGCNQTFDQSKTLESHLKSHETESKSENTCMEVSNKAIFAQAEKQKSHLKSHEMESKGKNTCMEVSNKTIFAQIEKLESHLKSHEIANKGENTCMEVSNKAIFAQTEKLESQLKSHEIESKGENTCMEVSNKAIFAQSEKLESHLKSHEIENKGEYTCMEVSNEAIFAQSEKLESHLKLHEIESKGGNTCMEVSINKAIFAPTDQLETHVKTRRDELHIHASAVTNCCAFCGKSFKFKCNLANHLKNVHGSVEGKKKLECDICLQVLSSKANLVIHKRVHSGEKPFVCDFCNKGYSSTGALNRHMIVHMQIAPFECDICKKKFCQLETHVKTHGDELHIRTSAVTTCCAFCGKAFKFKCNLANHLKNVHGSVEGKKKLECDICLQVLSSKANLVIHKRVHSGEKPFVCDFCNKGYTSTAALNRHMIVHMEIAPFECDICKKKFRRKDYLTVHMRSHNDE